MQDVGDKQRVVKKSSGGPNYGILFFVAAGVIVLAVGVFFLFGWIGDTLNGDGGSSGDAGAGSGDVGGGDTGNVGGVGDAGVGGDTGNVGGVGDAGVGDAGDAGAGDAGAGDAGTAVDYSYCNQIKERGDVYYMGCMVSVGVSFNREICLDEPVEWSEIQLSGELEGVSTIDYCWNLMANKKNDISYCDNIVGSSIKVSCEGFFGGGV
jgi:hypothetical protein